MNCLEFRRAHDVSPHRQDEEFRSHLRTCVECAAFAQRAATLERHLSAAMSFKTPENLCLKDSRQTGISK